jgi:hypothetical protein
MTGASTPRMPWFIISPEPMNIAETGVTYLQNSGIFSLIFAF